MLTKMAAKQHALACTLLAKDELTIDDKGFVLENFHEAGDSNNRKTCAHFTPTALARDFVINLGKGPVLDLCAGIGTLGFVYRHWLHHDAAPQLTCVEINPRYVEVGKKILPEAEWICGDIFDREIQAELAKRHFATAMANPPFGNQSMRGRKAPCYRGSLFEYAVIDIASGLADDGVFIIPQGSAPFLYSGVPVYQDCRKPLPGDPNSGQAAINLRRYQPFHEATGIELEIGVSVDTSVYRDDWRGVSPAVEIVTADFEEARDERGRNRTARSEQLALQLGGMVTRLL